MYDYICIYILCVYIYMYIYCIYICIYDYTCIYVMCVCTHTHIYKYTHYIHTELWKTKCLTSQWFW